MTNMTIEPGQTWIVAVVADQDSCRVDSPGHAIAPGVPAELLSLPAELSCAANDHLFFEQGASRGVPALDGRRSVEVLPQVREAIERIENTRTRDDTEQLLPILHRLADVCSRSPLHHIHVSVQAPA